MSEQSPADVPEVIRFRRWLLPAAGLAAVLVLLVAVAMAWSAPERPSAARPAAELTPVTTAAGTPTPSAAPTPSGSVRPAVTPTPARTARPTRPPAPARSSSGPTRRPSTTTTTRKPTCTPAGVVDVVQVFTDGVVKVAARTDGEWTDQLCPGERIRVFWATYSRTSDGGAKLYQSQVRYLDRSQPTWTMRLALSGHCGDSWYVVAGNATIPQTLKPGVVPFGGGKLNWETGGVC